MAIVVEEEHKSGQGLTSVIAGGVVFIVIAVAVYYVFFKRPDLVEVVTPTSFDSTAALSKINLQPDEVTNSPAFLSLRSYVDPVQPAGVAPVANPFLGTF